MTTEQRELFNRRLTKQQYLNQLQSELDQMFIYDYGDVCLWIDTIEYVSDMSEADFVIWQYELCENYQTESEQTSQVTQLALL